MGARGPLDPYPLLSGSWQAQGQPQQNLPLDNPPAANTYGFNTNQGRAPIPFWGVAPTSLDPSNANFPVWDIVLLAGQTLPGLCAVKGGRAQRFDVKKSKGTNFGTLTAQGYDPAEFTITERIWTPQQLNALWTMMPILEPLYGALAIIQAVDVYHPSLAIRSIASVVIKDITLLHPSSIRDVWEMDIKCQEYVPPQKKNVTATVTGTTPIAITGVQTQSIRSPQTVTKPPSANASFTGPSGAKSG